jgi:molybdate transport system regulatory protein
MELSARNQLSGRIVAVRVGTIMAEVTLDLGGGKTLTSVITRGAVERLGLKEGDPVTAVVKATSVMIGK